MQCDIIIACNSRYIFVDCFFMDSVQHIYSWQTTETTKLQTGWFSVQLLKCLCFGATLFKCLCHSVSSVWHRFSPVTHQLDVLFWCHDCSAFYSTRWKPFTYTVDVINALMHNFIPDISPFYFPSARRKETHLSCDLSHWSKVGTFYSILLYFTWYGLMFHCHLK